MRLLVLALLLLPWLAAAPTPISDPAEMLPNPAQEKRAEPVGRQLRCLVCQNESIEDSNADLARDLRRLVRARIAGGDTDDAGDRLGRGPLRRLRAAPPALQRGDGGALGVPGPGGPGLGWAWRSWPAAAPRLPPPR